MRGRHCGGAAGGLLSSCSDRIDHAGETARPADGRGAGVFVRFGVDAGDAWRAAGGGGVLATALARVSDRGDRGGATSMVAAGGGAMVSDPAVQTPRKTR